MGASLMTRGATVFGCSGMWCFRMWGLKIIVQNPSPISALGVKSPHLHLLRVDKLLLLNPTSSNATSLNSRCVPGRERQEKQRPQARPARTRKRSSQLRRALYRHDAHARKCRENQQGDLVRFHYSSSTKVVQIPRASKVFEGGAPKGNETVEIPVEDT